MHTPLSPYKIIYQLCMTTTPPSSKQFEIELKDLAHQTVHDYKTGAGDLVDHLIGRTNQSEGCDTTYAFDRALKNSSFFFIALIQA